MLKAGWKVSPLSPSSSPALLERVNDVPGLFPDDVYSAFTFKPMHNLLIGVLEMLKYCFVGFIGSRALCSRVGRSIAVGTTFLNLNGNMHCTCHSLLAFIEKEFPVP